MVDARSPNELMAADYGALLLEFGLCLLDRDGDSLRGDADIESIRQRALNWFARHWSELQDIARESPAVSVLRSDSMVLLATLTDIIAENWLAEPGAILAAAIIAKLGFDAFCAADAPPWGHLPEQRPPAR